VNSDWCLQSLLWWFVICAYHCIYFGFSFESINENDSYLKSTTLFALLSVCQHHLKFNSFTQSCNCAMLCLVFIHGQPVITLVWDERHWFEPTEVTDLDRKRRIRDTPVIELKITNSNPLKNSNKIQGNLVSNLYSRGLEVAKVWDDRDVLPWVWFPLKP